MEVNKTFEQILTEIETETDPAKAKDMLAAVPEEHKKAVSDALTKKAAEAVDSIAASREAKRKQQELEEDSRRRTEANNTTFEQRLHQETLQEAEAAVFQELGIAKDEEKNQVRENIKKLDDGSTRLENLKKVVRRSAAAAFPDRFIGAERRVRDLESGASEFNSANAGGMGGSEGGDEDGQKFSKEAKILAQKSGVTVEEAQKYIDEGGLQGNRRFELGKSARK